MDRPLSFEETVQFWCSFRQSGLKTVYFPRSVRQVSFKTLHFRIDRLLWNSVTIEMISQPDGHKFFNFLRTELKYDAGDCYQTQKYCDNSFHLFKQISMFSSRSSKWRKTATCLSFICHFYDRLIWKRTFPIIGINNECFVPKNSAVHVTVTDKKPIIQNFLHEFLGEVNNTWPKMDSDGLSKPF